VSEEEVVVDVEEEDLVAVAVIITAGGDIEEEVIIAVIMDHVDFMDLFMVRVIIAIMNMDLLRQHQKMWLLF